MGGYDLYGRYYGKIEDAINAEMAQCNEIDLRYQIEEINEIKRKEHYKELYKDKEIEDLKEYISHLEERLQKLENK